MYAWNKPTVTNRASGVFWEIALNDKGGEPLDKDAIFSHKGQCLLEQSV